MASEEDVWAIVPVKETTSAKQRLRDVLPQSTRRELALAMFHDVLETLTAVPELAGIAVVTIDAAASEIARRLGAQIWSDGAREGHTGAVVAAATRLRREGAAMLTLPGDVPLVQPADIAHLIGVHRARPGFTIVPARDELGSNAIICAPAKSFPLRFGPDSFFPHLAAARACGIEPNTVYLPRIALDIDEPGDLAEFMTIPSATRARAVLELSEFLTDLAANERSPHHHISHD